MDISKGKRVSPDITKQIMSQLNKKTIVNNDDYRLKMELEQLMYILNKDKKL